MSTTKLIENLREDAARLARTGERLRELRAKLDWLLAANSEFQSELWRTLALLLLSARTHARASDRPESFN